MRTRWLVAGLVLYGGLLVAYESVVAVALILPAPAPWRAWAVAVLLWLNQH